MKGFSLIETLVVVSLFAVIGIVVSQATAVSLTGSRKADATTLVRENLSTAVSTMERKLRSAKSVTCTGGAQSISFRDENDILTNFTCIESASCASTSYVYSGSTTNRLTNSQDVCITACSFTCPVPTNSLPPNIEIYLQGRSRNVTGVEDTTIDIRTSVTPRAY